jgi:hypothetical protein
VITYRLINRPRSWPGMRSWITDAISVVNTVDATPTTMNRAIRRNDCRV